MVSRILSYADRAHLARPLYRIHDLTFVLARLGSISLAVLVFWYGLAQAPKEHQVIDFQHGNFNTFIFRLNVLIAVGLLQVHDFYKVMSCLLLMPQLNFYRPG